MAMEQSKLLAEKEAKEAATQKATVPSVSDAEMNAFMKKVGSTWGKRRQLF